MKKVFILICFIATGLFLIGQTNEKSSKGFVMDKVIKLDQDWQTCLTPQE